MSEPYFEDDTYSGQIDWKLWRRIVAHAAPYRRQLIGLAVSGFAIAVIDVLFPWVVGQLIDEAIERGTTRILAAYAIGYAGLSVALSFFVWFFIQLAGQTSTGVAYDLRRKGFSRLQELSFSFFDVRSVGWLLTRLTSDCTKISSLLPWFTLDLVWGTLTVSGIVIAMVLINWKLAIVVLLIVPPLAVGTWYFQRKLLESSRHIRRTNSQMTASYNECIMGVRTTKTLVREDANLGEFQTLSSGMFRHSMRNALQSAVYLPLVITIGSVGTGLALWKGGLMVMEGLSVGTLVAFMQYAGLLYMPIQELARRFTELQSAQAAAERVQSLLDEVPDIRDSDEVRERVLEHSEPDSAASTIDGGGAIIEEIEFRNVSFEYKAGERVLHDFNLAVRAGQTIALVGATGGGKSTIVNLVARFYEPTRGAILINGVDYRQRSLHWLQSNLGVVLQTPHLFSGSVRDNIAYGQLDASNEEIEAVARQANAHDFICALEHGYDTEVGEGGGNLSTGERQLISLARALLADPQIFIMDEATSSVDTETERLIQGAIDAALRNRIAFVIAHRLSTIRSAEVIVVIDDGQIIEQGTHAELMARRGRYRNLYLRQFANERAEGVLSGAK